MASRDLMHSISVLNHIPPISEAGTTAHVGTAVDTMGWRSLTFGITPGVLADADTTFTVLMEESDLANMSDATAVADADMLPAGTGQEAAAGFIFSDDNAVKRIGYVGGKRYCRITITPVANSSAAAIGAVAILGHPALAPT
jgi:hypothetical protein